MKHFIWIALAAWVFGSMIGHAETSKDKIDRLVTEYYASLKGSGTTSLSPQAGALFRTTSAGARPTHRDCEDQDQDSSGGNSCIDAACDSLGTYGCDTTSEISEVGDACRGNRSGSCLKAVCAKLGSYGCDTLSEIQTVGQICRGNINGGCMDTACGNLGAYGCDTASEVQEVGEVCRGVSKSCLKSVCDRLGSYGCDTISELREVALSCRGE